MSELKIGTVVDIASNKSVLDCCSGKRGRIVHLGVGGGWLLTTDHFCPVERTEEELTVIPVRQLCEELFADQDQWIKDEYLKNLTIEKLLEWKDRSRKALAALILREELPESAWYVSNSRHPFGF